MFSQFGFHLTKNIRRIFFYGLPKKCSNKIKGIPFTKEKYNLTQTPLHW